MTVLSQVQLIRHSNKMEKGEDVMFTDLLKELDMPRLEVQLILNKLENRKLFGRYKSSDESITILPAGMKALDN